MPRQNPRRAVGAPMRLEDDENYLSGNQNRDITKPAFRKLLAQSTVPYDPTLQPVAWNTRLLDQPFLQVQKPALCVAVPLSPRIDSQDIKEQEDFSKQLVFENDLDMATSESEGEDSGEEELPAKAHQDVPPVNLRWSSLRPALQLSIYEYVYNFQNSQDKNTDILRSTAMVEQQAAKLEKAAELLGLSSHELIDIEAQRAFRAREPITEEQLREEWWEDEENTYLREDLLSKGLSRSGDNWQEINRKYVAQMVHISKYTYATKHEIEIAKAYLETRRLKSKVAGKWNEDPEEYTMVLVSTLPQDPKSPIVRPESCFARIASVTQALPAAVIFPKDLSGTGPDARARSTNVAEPENPKKSPSTEISTVEDFARKHDPKIILRPPISVSQQEQRRGRLPIQPSDLIIKLNREGRAEIRKKRTPKRRAVSELRPSLPDESASGGVRLVVLENGSVGVDVGTRPTPEVESLLQTGLDASKRGNGTSLISRLQDYRGMPAAQDIRPRCFSDMQQKMPDVDSDHMPATILFASATGDTAAQPLSLNLKSTPPQPDWSPIASPTISPIASPSPSPAKPRVPDETASSLNPKIALPPPRAVETQLQVRLLEWSEARGDPLLPFAAHANGPDTRSTNESLDPSAACSNRDGRAFSEPPRSPDPINNGYDSGLGTSRATSPEPEVAKRQKPGTKQPKQFGNHTVAQTKKTGKGTRGSRAPYNTKKKKAAKELAAALPLVEKATSAP